ncbi:hypothetical protein [Peptoniphilus grossensis]
MLGLGLYFITEISSPWSTLSLFSISFLS